MVLSSFFLYFFKPYVTIEPSTTHRRFHVKILILMLTVFTFGAINASVIEIRPDDTVRVGPDGCVRRSDNYIFGVK